MAFIISMIILVSCIYLLVFSVEEYYSGKDKQLFWQIIGIIGIVLAIILIVKYLTFTTWSMFWWNLCGIGSEEQAKEIAQRSIMPAEWLGFFGNFFGALTGGLITLFVMWKTLENNKILQDEKRCEEEKDSARKLVLLWEQQKYEVAFSFEEWKNYKRVYNMRYTLLDLNDILDILSKIYYLDYNTGTKILDFNSNMLILESRRDKYSRIIGIDVLQLTNEQKNLSGYYDEILSKIHKQILVIDEIILNLCKKYSIESSKTP